jgi:hypothetical protein
MSDIITFRPEEAAPEREAVFRHQGIPGGRSVPARTAELFDRSVEIFIRSAAPSGVLARISKTEFADIYRGEGMNEARTPVADIYESADDLALFAVTVGARVCQEIDARFASGDPALGCMLDSVASNAADRNAELVQRVFEGALNAQGRLLPESAVLRYSPGYCGWHISGQRKLFEFLRPERIGISLRDSFLMEPLKSVSGVIIAGRKEIHDFVNTYDFCSRCEDQSCRERIRALDACKPK